MELLFAGLSLAGFLGGLFLMKSSLVRLEPQIGPVLRTGVKSPVRALLVGLALTFVIQSSSATSAMTVALVSAGVFGLRQAFAVVLGANVGTTVTGQIVAFGTLDIGLVLLGTGVAAQLPALRHLPVGRSMRLGDWGGALGGLGAVFACLWCTGRLLRPLVDGGSVAPFFEAITESREASLLFGVALTAVVQSSSAVTSLLIGWVDSGVVPVSTGVAGALGSNIGTVVTTILASLSGGPAAKRTAAADLLFNTIGVLLIWPAISWFEWLVTGLAADPGRQIAHAHTLFNLATVLLIFPFLSPFCRLIERLIPDRRNG